MCYIPEENIGYLYIYLLIKNEEYSNSIIDSCSVITD